MHGNPALASASYNAGPHRTERWLAAGTGLEPELWVEFVPYRETRQYVKRVMEYCIVYQHRLGASPDRLSDLLRPLPPVSAGPPPLARVRANARVRETGAGGIAPRQSDPPGPCDQREEPQLGFAMRNPTVVGRGAAPCA